MNYYFNNNTQPREISADFMKRDIMINLGYADLEMGEADFKNPTFPPNTVHFLRSIKEEYAKMDEPIDVNVIVDVNKDKFISIKNKKALMPVVTKVVE